jgi:exosortase N
MTPLLKFAMRWIILKDYHSIGLFACAALVGGAVAFPTSFLSNTNVLLGLCLIPFSLFLSRGRKFNYTYFCLTLIFGAIAYSYSVRAFYFFMLGFYGLFLIELYFGKVNSLAVFLLAFAAPLFHQVSVILGFPIRLKLSEWAGAMILMAGKKIQVEGNMMTMDGNAFTVDDACMGLSMLSTSLLMGVAVIANQYRVTGLRLNFSQIFIFFLAVFVLNIASNLLRIVILVLFHILPDDPMHEIIGILCLVLYVVVPLYFLSKMGIKRYGRTCENLTLVRVPVRTFPKIVLACMAITVVVTGVHINSRRSSPHEVAHVSVELPGATVEKMDEGITKLYNEEILVYLKPIPEFFTSEHTPLLCWKGSGFEFQSVRKATASGHEIYIGRLEKPGEVLFTAWWYNNGNITTVEQWDWRVRMLRGEKRFCLVNVTAKDESLLMSRIEEMLRKNWLNIKFS